MDVAELLVDMYDRIPTLVRGAVEGVTHDQLTEAPRPGANTIAWLLWHLARLQDHHMAEILGEAQLWVTGDWAALFGLAPDPNNTGYGHGPDDVAKVRPRDARALVDYLDAVYRRTRPFLAGLSAGDLDRIVDRRW